MTEEQALTDLADVINAVTTVQAKRNALTHNLFALSFSPGTIGRLYTKQKGKKTKKIFFRSNYTYRIYENFFRFIY